MVLIVALIAPIMHVSVFINIYKSIIVQIIRLLGKFPWQRIALRIPE